MRWLARLVLLVLATIGCLQRVTSQVDLLWVDRGQRLFLGEFLAALLLAGFGILSIVFLVVYSLGGGDD